MAGPPETTSSTVDPSSTSVPAPGSCWATVPSGASLSRLTMSALRPSSCRVLTALSSGMPSTAGTLVVSACVKYHHAPAAAAASSARIATTSQTWPVRERRRCSSLIVSRSIEPSSRARTVSVSRTTACSSSGSPSGGAAGPRGGPTASSVSTRSSTVVVSVRTLSSRSSRMSLPFFVMDAARCAAGGPGIPGDARLRNDAGGYSNQTSVASTTYRLTSARPSNSTALPSPVTCQSAIAVSASAPR